MRGVSRRRHAIGGSGVMNPLALQIIRRVVAGRIHRVGRMTSMSGTGGAERETEQCFGEGHRNLRETNRKVVMTPSRTRWADVVSGSRRTSDQAVQTVGETLTGAGRVQGTKCDADHVGRNG